MNFHPITSIVLALSLLAGCGGGALPGPTQPVGETQPPVPEQISDAELALSLLKLECVKTPGGNVILSPLSIRRALAMAANGADGQAKTALETLLGMDAGQLNAQLGEYLAREDDTLSIANSMWFSQEMESYVNQEFKDTLAESYRAEEGAFAPYSQRDAGIINAWVKDRTHGKVDSIVTPDALTPETLALLINALYFNGQWADPFEDYQVSKEKFHAPGGDQDGELMAQRLGTYFETDAATGFAKSYRDGYEFVGILPKAEGAVDHTDLAGLDLEAFLASRTGAYDVDVKLPKFELDYSTSLVDTLTGLGLGSLFGKGSLNGLLTDAAKAAGNEAHVSDVLHKTYMKMYEEGTEAAAVTAVIVECTSAAIPVEREVKQVFLDRPFAFLIRDTRSGQTVFCGVINNIM